MSKTKGEQFISTLFGGRALLSGLLSGHLKFILYIFFLLILYISINNAVEKTLLVNYRVEKELKLLHAEHIRKSADLMQLSQQQEIEKQ
ncbi:MAG TPA: FtsL-like putative cell division protein, partial [Bacteroidales bacterium]|nr:FtsL-like putative cell division protein [Bacteroidales bacterium]